jgi:hypothetical protein
MPLDRIVSLFDQTDRGPLYSMEIALFFVRTRYCKGHRCTTAHMEIYEPLSWYFAVPLALALSS